MIAFDCEVYPNYACVVFKEVGSDKSLCLESGNKSSFSASDLSTLRAILTQKITLGYNSIAYDNQILCAMLKNYNCEQLYRLSKELIESNDIYFQIARRHSLDVFFSNTHIDLAHVSPCPKKSVSLKLYAGRLNFHNLQDLPFNPNSSLNDEAIDKLKQYCYNDVDATIHLYHHVKDEIELRQSLTQKYNIYFNSLSRPKLAERLIKIEYESKYSAIQKLNPIPFTFKFKSPDFFSKVNNPVFKELLAQVESAEFSSEKVEILPKSIQKIWTLSSGLKLKIGAGGLHSQETCKSYFTSDSHILIDYDVESYYPSLIRNLKLYPKNLGTEFLDIYNNMIERRLQAKANKNKFESECLKIVINSVFGKFKDKYSFLYSPENMIHTTLTGQLSILILIFKLDSYFPKIEVISSNTDGLTLKVSNDADTLKTLDFLVKMWQELTSLKLEKNLYRSMHIRDVNNYFVQYLEKDELKLNGIFKKSGISKNHNAYICYQAVIDFVTKGIDICENIRSCQDITQFVILRKVNKGSTIDDRYVGKVIRWVWVQNGSDLLICDNKHKVPLGDSSLPLMLLNYNIKDYNLDYDRYIQTAKEILKSIDLHERI